MKHFGSTFFLLLSFFFALTGCQFNSEFKNLPSDKKDAEKITDSLYTFLKEKKYQETVSLFSNRFFEESSKEKLFEIFVATNSKLGKLKSTSLEAWETRVVKGSNPASNYSLKYRNTYEKFEAIETIRLTKEKDGKIRIISYFINSDGFLKL